MPKHLVTFFHIADPEEVKQVHGGLAGFMYFAMAGFIGQKNIPELEGPLTATVEEAKGGFIQFRLEGFMDAPGDPTEWDFKLPTNCRAVEVTSDK